MAAANGLRFWPATDVGRVRDHNEDAFLVDKRLNLFVVADGMGGHAAGEVASQLASHTVREYLAERREQLTAYEQGRETDPDLISRILEQAVRQACRAVHEEGVRDETKRGMGTTLDVLLVIGDRGFIAHVGDARIYMVRRGTVHQLTEDHSLLNELLKRGRLTRDQIEKLDHKNAVTRAVGVYEDVEVDTLHFDVLAGDRFLLCSDGLHGYLEESELLGLVDETGEEDIVGRLIELANDRGGKDNITAVFVRVPDPESGIDRLAREVHLKMEVLHGMPMFRSLTYQQLVRLLNLTAVRSYAPGSPVVHEGEDGEEMFIVLEGAVKVHSGETALRTLTQGEHFGEMALINQVPRTASVTADSEAQLLVFRRREFFTLLREDHDVAVKLLWAFLGELTERLRVTSRELGAARTLLGEDVPVDLPLGMPPVAPPDGGGEPAR
ncbi:MAG TPA: Stp1/IreP family PP2C-type Ser/Thr phosphatase [Polyangiaceae bacterium LLY-WYZ-14_1]|nr:Stp1/IreP family PP2C-type Ser/Thr phosphatase [Polyangiaceae bacterium LLY-WYZ-14_1]